MAGSKKICPDCGEELWAMHLPAHRLKYHGIESVKGTKAAEPQDDVSRETDDQGEHETVADVLEAVERAPAGESESAPRKPGLMDRLRSRRGRGRGGQHSSPATAERAPKRKPRSTGRRVALDTDISDVWAFAGRRLERTPHFATGRMLEYQAPAAGVIIDRAIAGTLPDRVLFQPLARNRDKYEDVGFLLAGPLLTFSITMTGAQMQAALDAGDDELFMELDGKLQMQREMFVWVLRAMLPRLAEGKKRAEEKKAKMDATIADAFPELGGEDPVEVLAAMLFTPPSFQEASQNGKHEPSHASTAPGGEGPVFE